MYDSPVVDSDSVVRGKVNGGVNKRVNGRGGGEVNRGWGSENVTR